MFYFRKLFVLKVSLRIAFACGVSKVCPILKTIAVTFTYYDRPLHVKAKNVFRTQKAFGLDLLLYKFA